MSTGRTFPTTAAVRYDRALRKSLKLNPLPPHVTAPQFTCRWPAENVVFLERYRDWLVGIGSSDAVINQHRIPMAGHVLGLSLKPHDQLNLAGDFDLALRFVKARGNGERWKNNCRHSLKWFRRFVKEERGMVIIDQPSFGDAERYKAGLPEWLTRQLTKYLHIRQANWRPSRMAQATYHYWYKSTQIWRWLFAHTGIQEPQEITRDHLFDYIDEQLVAGYKVSTINNALHTFQATLRFLQRQGIPVPHALLTLNGLKKPNSLPRFLTDAQVIAIRDDFMQRVEEGKTVVAKRNSRLDLAAFFLLWQCGIRVSELEDLRLTDVDFAAGQILIREAKGLKDRMVYLTERVTESLQRYLEVRGLALTEHLFIYRHKPLSKDIIRCRIKAAGERLGFKATPHMLRHTFGTQLVNAGAKITTIQALLGHERLNSTMVYAHVHDKTVIADYFRAMEQIEGQQTAVLGLEPVTEQVFTLLDMLGQDGLSARQKQILDELHRCLRQQNTTSSESIVNVQENCLQTPVGVLSS